MSQASCRGIDQSSGKWTIREATSSGNGGPWAVISENDRNSVRLERVRHPRDYFADRDNHFNGDATPLGTFSNCGWIFHTTIAFDPAEKNRNLDRKSRNHHLVQMSRRQDDLWFSRLVSNPSSDGIHMKRFKWNDSPKHTLDPMIMYNDEWRISEREPFISDLNVPLSPQITSSPSLMPVMNEMFMILPTGDIESTKD
jgi:hypothetical protein